MAPDEETSAGGFTARNVRASESILSLRSLKFSRFCPIPPSFRVFPESSVSLTDAGSFGYLCFWCPSIPGSVPLPYSRQRVAACLPLPPTLLPAASPATCPIQPPSLSGLDMHATRIQLFSRGSNVSDVRMEDDAHLYIRKGRYVPRCLLTC